MKISYLIFTHNEEDTLTKLFGVLLPHVDFKSGDEVVIADDYSTNPQTKTILNDMVTNHNCKLVQYRLETGYADKKNKALPDSHGDYIFALDGDERPTDCLLLNLKDIIQDNPNVDSYWVPRVNDFVGVYDEIATKWGWSLSPSTSKVYDRPMDINSKEYIFLKKHKYILQEKDAGDGVRQVTYKAVLVNAYDPQCRMFKNNGSIRWEGKLHERIIGNSSFTYLPMTEELSIYHDKTIETQIETNIRYNIQFDKKENQGFKLPG